MQSFAELECISTIWWKVPTSYYIYFDKSILTKISALGFTDQSSGIPQLGLAHSYSRAKVKFNEHPVDNMIIQSIDLLDQLDEDINTFYMRIR